MGAGRMMKWERGKWKVSHNRLIERKKENERKILELGEWST